MEKKVYLIYWDSLDDACEIIGYIFGTAEEAAVYCSKLNEGHKYRWEDYDWMELDCLNNSNTEE